LGDPVLRDSVDATNFAQDRQTPKPPVAVTER